MNRKEFTEMLKPTFARQLREYRATNGLTQKELAKKLRITDRQLGNLENEKAQPSALTFLLFLSLLDEEKAAAFLNEFE